MLSQGSRNMEGKAGSATSVLVRGAKPGTCADLYRLAQNLKETYVMCLGRAAPRPQ